MDTQLTSGGQILGELWGEFVASKRTELDAAAARQAERLAQAQALMRQAPELQKEIDAWQRANGEYRAAVEAWERQWAAWFAEQYGEVELWKVTSGAVGDVRLAMGDDDDDGRVWVTTVVLEAPDDLTPGANGLTRVTAVQCGGMVEETWLGPVAKMCRVKAAFVKNWQRAVYCNAGDGMVWLPPGVAEATVAKVEATRPAAPPSIWEWLEAVGFKMDDGQRNVLIAQMEGM